MTVNSQKVCEANSPSDWREKLFADLLQSVHLRSSVYFRPELGAPWGFSVADHGTAFHIVADGKCWVQVEGATQPVELVAGDFVVVPRGDAHIMRDSATVTSLIFLSWPSAARLTTKEYFVPVATVLSPSSSAGACSLTMGRPIRFSWCCPP